MFAKAKFYLSACCAVVATSVCAMSALAQNQISLSGFGQGSAVVQPVGTSVVFDGAQPALNGPPSVFSPLVPIIQADDVTPEGDVYDSVTGDSVTGSTQQRESGGATGATGFVPDDYGFGAPIPDAPHGPAAYQSEFIPSGEITGGAFGIPNQQWQFGKPSDGMFGCIRRIVGGRGSGARTFSVFGGWSWMMSSNSWWGGNYEYQDGNSAGFSFGQRRNSRWRSDFEFSWNRNEQEPYFSVWPVTQGIQSFGASSNQVSGLTPSRYYPPVYGQIDTYSSFFNIYCDLDRPNGRCLTPYVGCGVGVILLDGDLSQYSQRADFEDDTLFGFQAIGGVSKRLRWGSELFVEYRYLLTSHTYINVPPRQSNNYTFSGYSFRYRQQASDLILGLRWTF
ncbi:MAG: hypothetical protein AAF456_14010 [Planctomycetota bacterium]